MVVAHQGAVHNYPGMIFDFSVKGKVMINMIKYIKKHHCQLPRGKRGHQDKPGHGPPFYSEEQILGNAVARRTSKGISSCLCPTPLSEH
jgi:hypothetical protein